MPQARPGSTVTAVDLDCGRGLKAAVRGDAAGALGPAAVLGAIAVAAGTTACMRLRWGLALWGSKMGRGSLTCWVRPR